MFYGDKCYREKVRRGHRVCMCECVGARVWGVAVGVNGAGRAGLSEQGTLTSTPAGGEGMSSTCEAQSESMSAMRKSVSLFHLLCVQFLRLQEAMEKCDQGNDLGGFP